jgi:hypothetical protein
MAETGRSQVQGWPQKKLATPCLKNKIELLASGFHLGLTMPPFVFLFPKLLINSLYTSPKETTKYKIEGMEVLQEIWSLYFNANSQMMRASFEEKKTRVIIQQTKMRTGE